MSIFWLDWIQREDLIGKLIIKFKINNWRSIFYCLLSLEILFELLLWSYLFFKYFLI
jgi:hypothetical protein